MDNRRLCGVCGCEYYKHNYFSKIHSPKGRCVYQSDEKIDEVHPGDNCKYGLLERTTQPSGTSEFAQPEDAACSNFDPQDPRPFKR